MKNFLIAFFSFVVLDFIWLGLVMKNFNMKMLSEIGRFKNGQFDLLFLPALATYLLMAVAIVVFVVPKISGAESSFFDVVLYGGLMGLVVYGVFDLTNLAILKNYPVLFVVMDMSWGLFVFIAVSAIVKIVNL
jgi:uncharacterized membrane protein